MGAFIEGVPFPSKWRTEGQYFSQKEKKPEKRITVKKEGQRPLLLTD